MKNIYVIVTIGREIVNCTKKRVNFDVPPKYRTFYDGLCWVIEHNLHDSADYEGYGIHVVVNPAKRATGLEIDVGTFTPDGRNTELEKKTVALLTDLIWNCIDMPKKCCMSCMQQKVVSIMKEGFVMGDIYVTCLVGVNYVMADKDDEIDAIASIRKYCEYLENSFNEFLSVEDIYKGYQAHIVVKPSIENDNFELDVDIFNTDGYEKKLGKETKAVLRGIAWETINAHDKWMVLKKN